MANRQQRFSRPKAWHSAIGDTMRELLKRKDIRIAELRDQIPSFSVKMQLQRIVDGQEVAVPIVRDAIDAVCEHVKPLCSIRTPADRKAFARLHELRDSYPTDPTLEPEPHWSRAKARLAARDFKPV